MPGSNAVTELLLVIRGDPTGGLNALNQIHGKIKDVQATSSQSGGDFLGGLGKTAAIAAIGTAVTATAGAIAYGVKVFGDYQVAWNQLQTALKNTKQSLPDDQLKQTTDRMANLGFGTNDTITALTKLVTAGVPVNQALSSMGTIADLAARQHTSLADAARVVIMGAEGMGRSLKQLGIIVPATAVNANTLKTAQSQLAKAQDEYNKALAAEPEHDQKVADAKQNLAIAQAKYNDALQKYPAGSTQLAEAQKRVTDAQNSLNNLTSASTDKLTAAQQKLADAQQKVAAAQQATNNPTEHYGQLIDSINAKLGGAAEAQSRSIPGALNVLKAKFEEVAVSIGQKVQPVVTGFLNWIVQHMPEIQTGFNVMMGVLGAAFTAISRAIGFIVNNEPVLLTVAGIIAAMFITRGVNSAFNWAEDAIKNIRRVAAELAAPGGVQGLLKKVFGIGRGAQPGTTGTDITHLATDVTKVWVVGGEVAVTNAGSLAQSLEGGGGGGGGKPGWTILGPDGKPIASAAEEEASRSAQSAEQLAKDSKGLLSKIEGHAGGILGKLTTLLGLQQATSFLGNLPGKLPGLGKLTGEGGFLSKIPLLGKLFGGTAAEDAGAVASEGGGLLSKIPLLGSVLGEGGAATGVLGALGPAGLVAGGAGIGGALLGGLGSLVGGAVGGKGSGAQETGSIAGNIGGGAAAGALIGSVVPGIGTAIGAGVGAIVGSVPVIVKHWDQVKGGVVKAFDVLSDTVGGSVAAMADGTKNFFVNIGSALGTFFGKMIPDFFGSLADGTKNFFVRIGTAVGTFFGKTIPDFFTSLPGKVAGFFGTILGAIGGFFGSIGGFFLSLPGKIAGWFVDHVVAPLLQSYVAIGNFFLSVPGRVAGFFHDHIIQPIADAFGAVGAFFASIPSKVGGFFHDHVIQPIADVFSAIGNFFKQIPGAVYNFLKNVPVLGGIVGGIAHIFGHQSGGTIGPGEIGLVGERGPEIASGGRSGVTITPIPAATAGEAGQPVVPIVPGTASPATLSIPVAITGAVRDALPGQPTPQQSAQALKAVLGDTVTTPQQVSQSVTVAATAAAVAATNQVQRSLGDAGLRPPSLPTDANGNLQVPRITTPPSVYLPSATPPPAPPAPQPPDLLQLLQQVGGYSIGSGAAQQVEQSLSGQTQSELKELLQSGVIKTKAALDEYLKFWQDNTASAQQQAQEHALMTTMIQQGRIKAAPDVDAFLKNLDWITSSTGDAKAQTSLMTTMLKPTNDAYQRQQTAAQTAAKTAQQAAADQQAEESEHAQIRERVTENLQRGADATKPLADSGPGILAWVKTLTDQAAIQGKNLKTYNDGLVLIGQNLPTDEVKSAADWWRRQVGSGGTLDTLKGYMVSLQNSTALADLSGDSFQNALQQLAQKTGVAAAGIPDAINGILAAYTASDAFSQDMERHQQEIDAAIARLAASGEVSARGGAGVIPLGALRASQHGSILTGPTAILAGEGGEREAVVPEHKAGGLFWLLERMVHGGAAAVAPVAAAVRGLFSDGATGLRVLQGGGEVVKAAQGAVITSIAAAERTAPSFGIIAGGRITDATAALHTAGAASGDGGMHIGEINVHHPAADVDVVSAVDRSRWYARVEKRMGSGSTPARWPLNLRERAG